VLLSPSMITVLRKAFFSIILARLLMDPFFRGGDAMKRNAGLTVFFLLIFLVGCAPSSTINWRSTPEIHTASTEYYEVQLEPVTSGKGPYFDSFHLVVKNKTDRNLEIDWNRTRYVESGIRHGGFVWQGIDPDDVRDESVPPDIISPKSTFSRVIFPHKRLAYAPGYQRGWKLQGGLIPEGENGIDLVVAQNGKVIRHRITVRIIEE
jgi:hypothetical protein